MKRIRFQAILLAAGAIAISASASVAQPIVDSVKAIQKTNDKTYRFLQSLDPYGESYTFTNIIKWHVVDAELQAEIKAALEKEPFKVDPKTFRIDEIYLFSAPIPGTDRVEPFHILVQGAALEKKKKTSGLSMFGGDEDQGATIKRAFQGKAVIQAMHRTPQLLDDVNTFQGENVEIPGEIVPHGSQLVKDVRMRYTFAKMFTQFYSKRAIIDEQRAFYGLPTSDFEELSASVPGEDTIQSPIDPEQTQSLPEDQMREARSTRYDKLIDLSLNHLWVNASKNISFEIETGNSEVGLPFWTSGEGRVWLNLKNMIGAQSSVKLGLAFPFDLGESDAFFTARKMSGFWGASFDAYFAGIDFFSAFNLPLAAKFSYMPSGQKSNGSIIYNGQDITVKRQTGVDTTLRSTDKIKTFYRTSLIAQLYIPTILQLDLNNFLQVSVGIGIHNVQQSIIPGKLADNRSPLALAGASDPDKVFDLKRVSNPVSPHAAVEYVNHKNSKFGLSIAFDHLFTFGGWIELLQDHLRLEVSYTSPLIRDAKPWEPDGFFLITPRIYF